MGNNHEKQYRRAIMPQNLMIPKGYTCYFYRISSFPSSMEKIKCTVMGFSSNHKLYHLRDDHGHNEYRFIPYFYIGPGLQPYIWDDYFKVGTIVRYKATTKGHANQAEIIDVHEDSEFDKVVDIKDMRNGFVIYNVQPSMYYLDVPYYKDW
jgi:hypothetical protein